ncbi:LysR family transcriptional regulator [Advenella faeciporci]|uniref:LysR family transcriptional regulator n=2 Tax=Advenella faeciporci TaxID=797535 RepID=A0A918MXH9_9BURK|nr:LysR family transcriptional regulator [Advenella faeciporci]
MKIFLAVARLGTISSAGEKLGIEHSTVSRRIDRLEALLNVVLFDRRRSGYTLTNAGHSLVPHAEQMESALIAAVEECIGEDDIKGVVRVGTPEAFGIHVLAPSLMEIREKYPRLQIELIAQPQFPSLVSREVEILVTLDPPKMGRYKMSRLAQINYFLYASPGYLESHPPIDKLSDLTHHEFVDYIHDGSVTERYRILEELIPEPRRSFCTNSVIAQRAAAETGLGIILLTPYVAQASDKLVCILPHQPLVTRSLWVAAPEDLLKIKRHRYVWNHIRNLINQHTTLFNRTN